MSTSPRSLPPLSNLGLVAAGGAVGTLARVALSTVFPTGSGSLPWTTLVENVSGAFLLGCLLTVIVDRWAANVQARALLVTGVLGAYTTFATVGLELHLLVADGHAAVALVYVAATWSAGLLAGALGIGAGRALARWPR